MHPLAKFSVLLVFLPGCNSSINAEDTDDTRVGCDGKGPQGSDCGAVATAVSTDSAAEEESGRTDSDVSDSSDDSLVTVKLTSKNCIDPDLAAVRSDQTLMLCSGKVARGTMNFSLPTPCTDDGQVGCITTSEVKATTIGSLLPADIRSGVTIAGVTGTLDVAPSPCTSDGAVGCVTDTRYKSADTVNLAAKVLAGQTVAAVDGNVTLPAEDKVLEATPYGVAGSAQSGTLTIPAATNVLVGSAVYGEPSALQTPSYAPDFPAAGNVRSTDTVNGAAGTLADCSANGSGCYVPPYSVGTQPLKAIDFDTITPGVLKRSTVIAGVTGEYPSSTYLMADADGTADLTAASFDAEVKDGATSFEWFDAEGTRYAQAGDSDITPGNIRDGVTIFGATGGVSGVTAADEWNLRAGVTVGSVTGKLKVNCRNGGSTLTWGMGATKTATVTNATDTLAVSSHGFTTGDAVQIDFTTVPTGLNRGTNYFVIVVDSDSFKLATTTANALVSSAINILADGTGVIVWTVGATPQSATVTNLTDTLTVSSHGLATAQAVQVSFTTTPTGLNTTSVYFVIVIDSNNIKLATSPGNASLGTPINITADGTGVYVLPMGTGVLTENDSIDDYNFASSVLTNHPWSSSDNFCSGVEASTGDGNVWKDVTTDALSAPSACGGTPANCAFQDKISGLAWTKTRSTSMTWAKALDLCAKLTFNNVSGWRLPTEKEAMDAFNHGIRSAANSNWITLAEMNTTYFWSSTTTSNASLNAWAVYFSLGYVNNFNKTGTEQVVCVR